MEQKSTTKETTMNEFQKRMRVRLQAIRENAQTAARYCSSEEFEGCVLFEHLLTLQRYVNKAVDYYATDVPACDRDGILRMVREAQTSETPPVPDEYKRVTLTMSLDLWEQILSADFGDNEINDTFRAMNPKPEVPLG